MRIIQLIGVDGDHVGLYSTERSDEEQINADFQQAFEEAKKLNEEDYDLDTHTVADEILSKKGIERVIADEVYTTVI